MLTPTVGNDQILATLLNDPNSQSQRASVISVANATSLAGKYALVVQAAQILLNAAGTYDPAIATPGATGVRAVATESIKATYNCAAIIATFVTSATDFWQIFGSGTKIVRVLKIKVTGIATAATPQLLLLIKRVTATTGGTATTPAISQNDSNDAAPTAVVKYYASGSNPTPGTTGNNVAVEYLNLGAAVGGAAGVFEYVCTNKNDKASVLRGTGEGLALNLNGASIASGGAVTVEVTWTEE